MKHLKKITAFGSIAAIFVILSLSLNTKAHATDGCGVWNNRCYVDHMSICRECNINCGQTGTFGRVESGDIQFCTNDSSQP